MLIHPLPDPIAFTLGPVSIHWYGIMYGVALLQFLLLGKLRVKQPHIKAQGWVNDHLADLVFLGMIGVIVGGRLGEVFFYNPAYYFANPLEIFKIWKPGMSYHGGFLGVMVAMFVWSRKQGKALGDVYDFIAPLVPLGYAAGRIGNFINAELPGRMASADLPWAMVWPNVTYPVHPSPLYQCLVDGILLFVILWIFARKQRPRWAVGGAYTLLYGCARFITEYFRTPDYEVMLPGFTISSGQMLSLPMIAVGLAVIIWAYKRESQQKATLRSEQIHN